MPGDPAWLHEGPTWVLDVRGSAVAFFSIGAVARGAGRSVGTIRTWEKRGLIPKPTYTKPGRGVAGPKRAYLRSEIFDIIAALEQAGLIGQRPQRWSGPLVGPRA